MHKALWTFTCVTAMGCTFKSDPVVATVDRPVSAKLVRHVVDEWGIGGHRSATAELLVDGREPLSVRCEANDGELVAHPSGKRLAFHCGSEDWTVVYLGEQRALLSESGSPGSEPMNWARAKDLQDEALRVADVWRWTELRTVFPELRPTAPLLRKAFWSPFPDEQWGAAVDALPLEEQARLKAEVAEDLCGNQTVRSAQRLNAERLNLGAEPEARKRFLECLKHAFSPQTWAPGDSSIAAIISLLGAEPQLQVLACRALQDGFATAPALELLHRSEAPCPVEARVVLDAKALCEQPKDSLLFAVALRGNPTLRAPLERAMARLGYAVVAPQVPECASANEGVACHCDFRLCEAAGTQGAAVTLRECELTFDDAKKQVNVRRASR
ncbi:hypothetical protein [Vitiosangium sp. GDMCC 1.1324]|uniref:hypothetical protein n=1 Tax=Vitiosangium sp. (strain GDMCC 1.1324) TaxID=2138576 RepID=UPI0011B389AA|nr:hypothetical protein [Vitiosangium sp. GDMCC 1.1324]